MAFEMVDGVPVEVREGVDSRDRLTSELADEFAPLTEPGGAPGTEAYAQWAENLSPAMAGLLEMRTFIGERIPESIRPDFARPENPAMQEARREAHPIASGAGGMYFPMATAVAAGSGLVAQAATAGALKYAQEGSTPTEAGLDALIAAGGQKVGDMAGRVLSGAARYVAATKAGGQVLKTTSDALRGLSETTMGRGLIDQVNQKALMAKFGKVIGIDGLEEVNKKTLSQGQANIGKLYDKALEVDGPFDLTDVGVMIDDIPVLSGKKEMLDLVSRAEKGNQQAVRLLHKKLREKANNPALAAMKDELDAALRGFENSASTAGADIPLLKMANQRFKVLRTIDETPDAWIDGILNPRQLTSKFGRENKKGFGRAVKRENGGLIDDVTDFTDSLFDLATEAKVLNPSGTGKAVAQFGLDVGLPALGAQQAGVGGFGAAVLAGKALKEGAALASIGSKNTGALTGNITNSILRGVNESKN
jgi:hypothetical protein